MGAASPANASVDSPAPANSNAGGSAPPRPGAYSRFDGKLVVLIRDLEHRLLDPYVAHLLGQGAGFFRSPVPISVVVELRCKEHGTRPFSDPHTLTRKRHVALVPTRSVA